MWLVESRRPHAPAFELVAHLRGHPRHLLRRKSRLRPAGSIDHVAAHDDDLRSLSHTQNPEPLSGARQGSRTGAGSGLPSCHPRKSAPRYQ